MYKVIITKYLQNISLISQLQQCASIQAQVSNFSAPALCTCSFYARRSILCRIYTEYIHHFLSRLQILKVHYRNIARKLHHIFNFFFLHQWERKKALPCVSCIQMKIAFTKINVEDLACDQPRSVCQEHALSQVSSPEKVKQQVGSTRHPISTHYS